MVAASAKETVRGSFIQVTCIVRRCSAGSALTSLPTQWPIN
jgi:hypothetical protein